MKEFVFYKFVFRSVSAIPVAEMHKAFRGFAPALNLGGLDPKTSRAAVNFIKNWLDLRQVLLWCVQTKTW